MQQRAGDGDVAVDAGERRADRADRLRDRQRVLEQPVAVGLVKALGRRRRAIARPGRRVGARGRRPAAGAGRGPGPWRRARAGRPPCSAAERGGPSCRRASSNVPAVAARKTLHGELGSAPARVPQPPADVHGRADGRDRARRLDIVAGRSTAAPRCDRRAAAAGSGRRRARRAARPRGRRARRRRYRPLAGLLRTWRTRWQVARTDRCRLSLMARSALITGGTGGLGAAVTHGVPRGGWRVVVPLYAEAERERVARARAARARAGRPLRPGLGRGGHRARRRRRRRAARRGRQPRRRLRDGRARA